MEYSKCLLHPYEFHFQVSQVKTESVAYRMAAVGISRIKEVYYERSLQEFPVLDAFLHRLKILKSVEGLYLHSPSRSLFLLIVNN